MKNVTTKHTKLSAANMGQAKSSYSLHYALPHSVSPFSKHTTQVMPSLGTE
jgi:hypothetical protein